MQVIKWDLYHNTSLFVLSMILLSMLNWAPDLG